MTETLQDNVGTVSLMEYRHFPWRGIQRWQGGVSRKGRELQWGTHSTPPHPKHIQPLWQPPPPNTRNTNTMHSTASPDRLYGVPPFSVFH